MKGHACCLCDNTFITSRMSFKWAWPKEQYLPESENCFPTTSEIFIQKTLYTENPSLYRIFFLSVYLKMSTSHTKPGFRFQKQFNQETSDLYNCTAAAKKELANSDSFSHCACRSSNQNSSALSEFLWIFSC